jgi:hypothetical protein
MAEAKTRPKEKTVEPMITPPELDGVTPLEKMTELTRRILAVPKSEVTANIERKKRKHR